MSASFLDTNVLIYLASNDVAKAERAEALLAEAPVVSVQVLNEIANVARRKMALSWAELGDFLATIRALVTVEPLTVDTHLLGLALSERHGLSIYDGLIVAAAVRAGCEILWSEYMQDGMLIEGSLRLRNPFAAGD